MFLLDAFYLFVGPYVYLLKNIEIFWKVPLSDDVC